jgi:hypothetical protein
MLLVELWVDLQLLPVGGSDLHCNCRPHVLWCRSPQPVVWGSDYLEVPGVHQSRWDGKVTKTRSFRPGRPGEVGLRVR